MTNRQLAALETKRKLLEASKKIICEKGLLNTSIGEITKACGVSNGTFYTYFKRKEDVLFELSREMFQEIFEKAQHHDGPFIDRIKFFMIQFSDYIEKSSVKLCQEWVRNTVDPDLVDNADDKTKLYRDIAHVKGLIEKGIDQGELAKDVPVEILGHTIVDILYGEMLCWAMSGGAYSFKERTEEFCDVYIDLLMRPYLEGKSR